MGFFKRSDDILLKSHFSLFNLLGVKIKGDGKMKVVDKSWEI